jgi:molecular chaperone HtpG
VSDTQRFQVNLAGIIDLLSAHLYSGPAVYLRELLQNGVDALTARASLAGIGDASWGVRATCERGVLIFEDDGIGLLPDEMERFLSTIGESSKRGDLEAARNELLGQFGIGLLSCFMIADEIEVTSRSAKGGPTVKWNGRVDGTYTVRVVDEPHRVGTTVRIVPKTAMREWTQPSRVKELVAHYGSMLPWPVHVDGAHINPEPPPWQMDVSPSERARALTKFGQRVLGEHIFDVIPLRSNAGAVDGAAFVLARPLAVSARRGDRVYLKGMLLADDEHDLLPPWAFFVKAIVDARGLRPTASRESLYEDDVLEQTREELGDQIRAWLVQLAQSNPARCAELVHIHHLAMKQLASSDDEFLDVILDALPFETTHGELTFGEIVKLGRERELRFTTNRDAFRQMAAITRAAGMVLVNAAYVFEADILERASKARDVQLTRADAAELARDLEDAGPETRALAAIAEAALADVGIGVSIKRFRPNALPALYAADRDAVLKNAIQRTKAAATDAAWSGLLDDLAAPLTSARPELVLNAACPLIERLVALAKNQDATEKIATAVRVIYVQSLLLGHHPLGAQDLEILNSGIAELLEWGLT